MYNVIIFAVFYVGIGLHFAIFESLNIPVHKKNTNLHFVFLSAGVNKLE